MRTEEAAWDAVRWALRNAYSAVWDGCHKIYINLDKEQHDVFPGAAVEPHAPTFEELELWWDESCSLRFINAVGTDERGEPVFTSLIAQFEFDEDEEEDDDDDE